MIPKSWCARSGQHVYLFEENFAVKDILILLSLNRERKKRPASNNMIYPGAMMKMLFLMIAQLK